MSDGYKCGGECESGSNCPFHCEEKNDANWVSEVIVWLLIVAIAAIGAIGPVMDHIYKTGN